MAVQIQLRRDTAANWTSVNPTLASGEMGLETDTGKSKIGNGATPWNSLAYNNNGLPAVAVSAGTNIVTGGTVSFANSNNVSFGMNTAGVITAVASGGGGAVAFSDTPTVSWSQVSGTVSADAYNPIVAGGSSTIDYRVGFDTNGNVSFALNSLGSIYANAPAIPTSLTAMRVGDLAGNTGTNGTIYFYSSNGMDLGVDSNAVVTARFAGSSNLIGTSTAGTNVTWTVNSNGISFNGQYPKTGSIQIATYTNGSMNPRSFYGSMDTSGATLTIPVDLVHTGGTFYGTNASGTIGLGTNGLNLSVSVNPGGGGGALSVSAGTTSNALNNIVFSNSNQVSFGLQGSTITGSIFANYLADELTTQFFSEVKFASGLWGSWQLAGGVMSFNPNLAYFAPYYSAGTTDGLLSDIYFVNSNGVSFGLNGNTMTASVAAGGGAATDDHFYPFFPPGAASTLIPVADNTIYMRELELDAPVNAVRLVNYSSFNSLTSTFAIIGSISNTSSGSGWGSWVDNMTHYFLSKSGNPGQTGYNIYYTLSSATNSIGASMSASMTQATNAGSVSVSFSTTIGVFFPISINSNGNVTYTTLASNGSSSYQSNGGAAATISSTFANSSIFRQFSGVRPVISPMPGNTLGVLPAGELIYAMKHSVVSTNSGAYSLSRVPYQANSMIVYTTSASYIEIGATATANFINTNIYGGGFGSITGNSTASITNATGFNESIVNNIGSNASLWLAAQNYGYTLSATNL